MILMPGGRALFAAGKGGASPISAAAAFWFDASDATTVNAGSPATTDPVANWNDKSGNARHLSASGTDRPTYNTGIRNGLPGIRWLFSPASHMVTPSFALAQPHAVFLAIRIVGITAGDRFMDGELAEVSNPREIFMLDNGGVWGLYAGSFLAGPGLVNGSSYYLTTNANNTSSQVRTNGANVAGTAGTGAITTGMRIGAIFASMDAYVLEFFCIPNATAGNITAGESYLQAKWAL